MTYRKNWHGLSRPVLLMTNNETILQVICLGNEVVKIFLKVMDEIKDRILCGHSGYKPIHLLQLKNTCKVKYVVFVYLVKSSLLTK